MNATPAQLRHAFGLLRWSPLVAAWNARTSHESARKICGGYDTVTIPEEHLRAVQAVLEAVGIRFVPEPPDAYLRRDGL